MHDIKPLTLVIHLGLSIGCTLVPSWLQAQPVDVDRQQRALDIPAGSLDRVLNRFALAADIELHLDAALTLDRASSGLQGVYSVADAFDRLLSGSGLIAQQQGDGSYRLVEAGVEAPMSLTPINVEGKMQGRGADHDWVYQEPRSVSVISREDIDKRPPRHAADMLVDTPGVTSKVDRHNPALSVNIRGMQDFGRVNMMIDGMRQNHVESGHQQRNGEMYVDSELLSRVVIEKGPSAGVHGANAIAGSANFQTLDYDDIILPGQDQGVRLRGTTGVGGYANGMHFLGSAAVAGRFDDRLELLFARSNKNQGEYRVGDRGRTWFTSGLPPSGITPTGQEEIREVRFSDQEQDSLLAKARFQINESHSVQFSYINTENSYANVSAWSQRNINGWSAYGDAKASSDSYSLDWNFSPDNPLIDLKAKLYFVTTDNQRVTMPTPNAAADNVWGASANFCLQDPVSSDWIQYCLDGMRSKVNTRTDTWGMTLENTSYFDVGVRNLDVSANYGVEWFQDEGKSKNSIDRNGVSTAYLDESAGNSLNPNGRRDVASAFSSLTVKHEPFTLKAGLRYDWYHLRGKTDVPSTKSRYLDRFDSYMDYFHCGQANESNPAACAAGYTGGVDGAVAFLLNGRRPVDYWTDVRFAPFWTEDRFSYEYDVDRSMGKFSPFISASWQLTDWFELFGNWGKGFRPPAMTETLWEGGHSGDSSAYMYPNPLLEPERSTSWELGFNILHRDLFKPDDKLSMKMAYFDTRVDNFVYTSSVNGMPGQIPALGLGNAMFVNNLAEMKFRGVELETDYDAGGWYVGGQYTKYLGGPNDFCKKLYPLGVQSDRVDQPLEDGSMDPAHLQAIAEGYGSYREKADAMVGCATSSVMNSARIMPMDQHGIHLGIRAFSRTLDLGVRYHRGEASTDYGSEPPWDSYTTWDLYARYQPTQNLLLNFTVENVRDESYQSGYSDNYSKTYAPGRTFLVGSELRF